MKPNLLVISDGNGVDTDFKKWPFYLKLLLTDQYNVINRSVVGASNELMFMQLGEALRTDKISKAIIQWSKANRLDVVTDNFWDQQAAQDPVYHFNFVENNQYKWWVSSASKNQYVQDYHTRYIKYWQAQQRTQAWMLAAAELLKSNNVDFCFSLCYNFTFADPFKDTILNYPWVWHQQLHGLSEFRYSSEFLSYDTGLPRPHTLIQLDWIDKVLLPSNFINYSPERYKRIQDHVITSCLK